MYNQSQKNFLRAITNACVKITVRQICFEKNAKEHVVETFKNICTVAVHC